MKILAIIPARGGSKGIPKKNIVGLGGKPLIAWTIEAALGCSYIDKVVVSSDDKEILATAKKWGAQIVKRPKKISGDHSPFQPLIFHTLAACKKQENYTPNLLVYLQPTSPLRTSQDISQAIEKFLDKKAGALISVYSLDKKYLKAFVINKEGYLVGAVNNKYPFANRQDLPDLYMPNGAIYIIKTKLYLKYGQLFSPRTLPYEMSWEQSIDIDNPADLKTAEELLKKAGRLK